jgi:hypothetical protein
MQTGVQFNHWEKSGKIGVREENRCQFIFEAKEK